MAESEEDRHLKMAGEFDCLPEPLPTLRHSTSHVMAQAVKQLFPDVRWPSAPPSRTASTTTSPRPRPFTPEDLEKIEARMREIVEEGPALRPRGLAARAGHPLVRGARRALQGGDPARPRRADGVRVQAGRLPRPLPRAPRGLHGRDQGLQAPLVLRRLLARGREEPDAPAHLRDGLAHPGGPGQASLAAGGGEEARPPQARPRARPLRLPRRRRPARRSGCPTA